jgi:hypothetical protein
MLKIKQRGQVVVAFALVMVGFMFILIVATLDLQALSLAYNRADTTALLAAQAGAGAVCITISAPDCPAGTTIYDATPGSRIYLNQTEVNARCAAVAPQGNPPLGFTYFKLTCKVTGPIVVVTVVFTPRFLANNAGTVALFGSPRLTLTRNGQPAYGCGNGAYTFNPLNGTCT